jgi:hypothetical protein
MASEFKKSSNSAWLLTTGRPNLPDCCVRALWSTVGAVVVVSRIDSAGGVSGKFAANLTIV